KKLPKSEELSELIRGITAIGAKHGIEIDNLKIGSIISRQYYQEHSYSFSITSTYHRIARFFADICQEERIMTVRDLKLVPGSATGTGRPRMQAMFTLVVYTYKG
ncbi:MAG: type 4a pilus biogenesis protein PilO, partial [Elusimicrobia bacterium]|nr:type 4a pilus biogenesis protein PilO [Elusimicrobiota bacterium]